MQPTNRGAVSWTRSKQTPWPESVSELYRLKDRRFSAKLLPTFADRGCHVVSMTDPYSRNLDFLDRRHYFFFQVAPQLYSKSLWTPFQIHYFSENLVAPRMEAGSLDL
jgi:hypothetical protein